MNAVAHTKRIQFLFIFLALIFFKNTLAQASLSGDALYCIKVLLDPEVNETIIAHELALNAKAVGDIIASRQVIPEYVSMPREPYSVGRQKYTAYARLGSSISDVLLAKSEQGTVVVVKDLNPMSFTRRRLLLLHEYEELVTEYYRSKGVDLPRIIARDPEQAILIKEYEEGLRIAEIKNVILKTADNDLFESALLMEQQRLKKIHEGFVQWLQSRNPSPSADLMEDIPFNTELFPYGDFGKKQNFIFSLKKGRWILIDP